MEIQTYPSRDEARDAITIPDKNYMFVRHVFKPGGAVKLHFHPKANEWLIVSDGEFQVRLEEEKRMFNLQHQAIAIHFPAGQKHSLAAISDVSYSVLRDREDKTVYCNNPL